VTIELKNQFFLGGDLRWNDPQDALQIHKNYGDWWLGTTGFATPKFL